ncbi:MAG TPA: TonB-dependent receptor [Chitinophagaceae bacterium]|nr:TonB-dependent receptor [Chitinophagaceae bacterium]
MKHYFILLLFFIPYFSIFSQAQQKGVKDSVVNIKVYGNCGQCKDRIEGALKVKGVKKANWSIETKMLSLVFNPSIISLDKIHSRIAAAGHDTELKKADDKVYQSLPECCLYRTQEEVEHTIKTDSIQNNETIKTPLPANLVSDSGVVKAGVQLNLVKGVVLELDKKGEFKPLQGASVVWLNSNIGVVTDSSGYFSISSVQNNKLLEISFTGYKPDTVEVRDVKELKIILASGKQLAEVRVTSRQRSLYLSSISPIRMQVMTEKELFKAACCNLSESFETNPSVDVSYNDAVTGSKQIQLLGLSGNYTQLTVENLPGPRGLATPLGLNSIAGPWVESIQLTKGIGSVANGFESIAGQINVELKKPEKSEKLYANAYVNDFGKADFNLTLSQKIGKKWATALLLHDDFLNNKTVDFNKDGFRDLPTGNLFSAISRWVYTDDKGIITQFGFKILNDRRTGGETSYTLTDKFTNNYYGLGINTDRYEGFAKIGYVFPAKKYKSIGLQLSAFNHQQDSYFGYTVYNAKQNNFYGNLIYQSIIGNTNHKFRTGVSFSTDNYDERYNQLTYKRTETVPGAFFEYTYTHTDKLTLVAGIRTDYNNLYGWYATPRLHVRYEPAKGTTLRISAGRGQRTANIFAENTSVFISSRQVSIIGSLNGKAYGLDQEIAWNKGISFDQKFKLFTRDGLFSLDFFRNDFTNQVVVDLENPREIKFYNLSGKSYSNSLQAELTTEPIKKLELRLAYRFFDIKTTYSGQLLQKPLTAKHRAFANLAYEINGWKLDYTFNYNGQKRIPNTSINPPAYQRNPYSTSYILMNAQLSKTIGKKNVFDIYVGVENLANYFQKDVIIAANNPFSQYFDASLVWGPVNGRMFYTGFRFKIK